MTACGGGSEAEARVVQLRAKVALLREKRMQSQIVQLAQENGQLKRDIESLKEKYEKSLLANGKAANLLPPTTGPLHAPSAEHQGQAPPIDTPLEEAAPEKSPKKLKKEKPKAAQPVTPKVEEKIYDVSKLDLRIGYIREVSRHPDADTLYVEQIECGDQPGNEGGFGETRTVCSGLVANMTEDELRNKLVVVMCNLKPVKMRGVTSQGMVMCATLPGEAELLQPPPGAQAGDRVVCKEYPGQPEQPFMNPKKKIWESLKGDLKVDQHGVVRYKDAPLEVDGKGLLTSKTSRSCPVT